MGNEKVLQSMNSSTIYYH